MNHIGHNWSLLQYRNKRLFTRGGRMELFLSDTESESFDIKTLYLKEKFWNELILLLSLGHLTIS
jgi:hypothetical protein